MVMESQHTENIQLTNDISQKFVFRACRRTYIVFTLICSPPFILGLVVLFQDPGGFWIHRNWVPFMVSLVGWTFYFSCIGMLKITLANGILSYRSFGGGTRSIALSDIQKVTITGMLGLVIKPKRETKQKPITISMRIFDQNDIDRLLDVLNVPRKQRRYSIFKIKR